MRPAFDMGACVDLGAFDPALDDAGVAAWLDRADRSVGYVVLMEDRQPVFFHDHQSYSPDAPVPLNRHGPSDAAWTHADLRRLVAAFHDADVKVLLGYWVHECPFVDDDHPELLIRDATGALWQDVVEKNADFNPMRRLRADPARGIEEGTRYPVFAAAQWRRLATDFGFDGLFLGDGAMGFRRHGIDWKDLRHFDYHEAWLADLRADVGFDHHDACALERNLTDTAACARDVHAHHWEHWVQWNCDRWTAFYREMADAVHAQGGLLAAYNCMNYDPALARLHGVDYRAIAESGLDLLVFQAYDHAWGPNGPFGDLALRRKDLETNLAALLRTRAHVGFDTPMRIVVTVETEDEVEGWNAPLAHTLGELLVLGEAVATDAASWRRAADGAFVVWGNSVPAHEWSLLAAAARRLSAPPALPVGPRAAFAPGDERRLAARGVPMETTPEALYAHLDGAPATAITTAMAPAPRAPRPAHDA